MINEKLYIRLLQRIFKACPSPSGKGWATCPVRRDGTINQRIIRMKTTLFIIILLFSTTASQAQQLSPNFYNQFKDILTANWENIRDKEINKKGNENNYIIAYDSKKNLDGFKVNTYQSKDEWGESKDVMATMEKPIDNAPQSFEQIIVQLKKLQVDGYVLKPDADIPGALLKRISIYKGTNADAEAKISLFKTGNIEISFYKYQLPAPQSAATAITLSPDFYEQFKAILSAKWEDLKSDNVVHKKDNGKGTTITYYNSKKPLDGFNVLAMDVNSAVFAFIPPNPANVQLFELMLPEIYKLKSDGYAFQDMTHRVQNAVLSLRMVQDSNAFASFTLQKDNRITIYIFTKGIPQQQKK